VSCGICQLGQSSYCRDACMNSYLLSNGICEDGGPGSEYSQCPLGTDCSDCGIRFFVPPPSPASPPDLPSPPAPPAPPPLPFEPPTPPAPPPAPVVAFSNWNSYSNPSGWTNGGHTSSKYVGTSYSLAGRLPRVAPARIGPPFPLAASATPPSVCAWPCARSNAWRDPR
jgi:hypothetical protein